MVRYLLLVACGLAATLTTTGCSSSSEPSWASALGSGVTVQAPAQTAPGNGSPAAAVQGFVGALEHIPDHPAHGYRLRRD
jgi:hypothetical protein